MGGVRVLACFDPLVAWFEVNSGLIWIASTCEQTAEDDVLILDLQNPAVRTRMQGPSPCHSVAA